MLNIHRLAALVVAAGVPVVLGHGAMTQPRSRNAIDSTVHPVSSILGRNLNLSLDPCTRTTCNASGAPVTPHARTLAMQAVDSPFLVPTAAVF